MTDSLPKESESIRDLMLRTDSKGQKYSYVSHAMLDQWANEVHWLTNELRAEQLLRQGLKTLADKAERMHDALNCLLPGLILDLRYAEPDDDKEAMRSRIQTVAEALADLPAETAP